MMALFFPPPPPPQLLRVAQDEEEVTMRSIEVFLMMGHFNDHNGKQAYVVVHFGEL